MSEILLKGAEYGVHEGDLIVRHAPMLHPNRPAHQLHYVFDVAILEEQGLVVLQKLLRQGEEVTRNLWMLLALLLGAEESDAADGDSLVAFHEELGELWIL